MQGTRAKPTNAHVKHGDITSYGGIASARVTAWADALDTTPEAVVSAADVVPPLVDTGTRPSNYESHDRPTAPHLRCIAWNASDLPEVKDALAS